MHPGLATAMLEHVRTAHGRVSHGAEELRARLRVLLECIESGSFPRDRADDVFTLCGDLFMDGRLEDVHLLVGQVYYAACGVFERRGCGNVIGEAGVATAECAWPALGIIRAAVVAPRHGGADRGTAEAALVSLYVRRRAQFDGSAYLCSVLVDVLDALHGRAQACAEERDVSAMLQTVVVPLVAMRSDLVAQRLARLLATLAADRACVSAVVAVFRAHVGPDTRLRYLSLQHMLANPACADATDAIVGARSEAGRSSADVVRRITGDSAIAPAVCDFAVAMLRAGRLPALHFAAALATADRSVDVSDNIGRFLLPRLAKRARPEALAVLSSLRAIADDPIAFVRSLSHSALKMGFDGPITCLQSPPATQTSFNDPVVGSKDGSIVELNGTPIVGSNGDPIVGLNSDPIVGFNGDPIVGLNSLSLTPQMGVHDPIVGLESSSPSAANARRRVAANATEAYVALAAAMLWSGTSSATTLGSALATPTIIAALDAHGTGVRLAALQVLCRSTSASAFFDPSRAHAARRFLVHAMLATGSAARQQTAAALAALFAAHIGRLYALLRDGTGDTEAADMISYWRSVARILADALPRLSALGGDEDDRRMFHRTDLALRVALSLVRAVQAAWTPAREYPQNRAAMGAALLDMLAPLLAVRGAVVATVALSPYDAAQALASDVHCALEALVALLSDAGTSTPVAVCTHAVHTTESALATLATSRKQYELEGAARILALASQDCAAVCATLIERLKGAIAELSGALLADADAFSQSSAVGTFFGLRRLLPAMSPTNASAIVRLSLELCRAVVAHLAHPTPEGGTSFAPEDSDAESDDGDAYTAMALCWRAAKYGCALASEALVRAHGIEGTLAPIDVARQLCDMLLSVRHPGVFTALPAPLMDVLKLCAEDDVARLLDDVLLACLRHPAITTTRRSGGLPLCVAAIVSSGVSRSPRNYMLEHSVAVLLAAATPSCESERLHEQMNECKIAVSGSICQSDRLQEQMDECVNKCEAPVHKLEGKTLFHISETAREIAAHSPAARVHALNILRQLARETLLADAFRRDHVARPFAAALVAFHAQDWAVRNSGMMLFAALATRVFGVAHDADPLASKSGGGVLFGAESLVVCGRDATHVNVCDVRAIKCDELLALVAERMEDASRPVNTLQWDEDYVAAFAVCPLVTFAQRVRFPTGALDALQARLLAATLSLLVAVLGSRILKARLAAARVLRRLDAEGAHVRDAVLATVCPVSSSNLLHGALLYASGDRAVVDAVLVAGGHRVRNCPYLASLAGVWHPETTSRAPLTASPDSSRDISATLRALEDRTLAEDEIEPAIASAVAAGADIAPLLESFWTGAYDVAGAYRRAAVRSWRPEHAAHVPSWRRLHFLALTDDDEDVRMLACDGRFGGAAGACALPGALCAAIGAYGDEIADLLEWMPRTAGGVLRDRESLFAAEPMNTFKDVWWQRLVRSEAENWSL